METLVATVLIVLIFMISTFVLNSLFNSTVRAHRDAVQARMTELMYLTSHEKVQLPYDETFGQWLISIEKVNTELIIEATLVNTNKTIRQTRYEE